jgi:hypothetical protein
MDSATWLTETVTALEDAHDRLIVLIARYAARDITTGLAGSSAYLTARLAAVDRLAADASRIIAAAATDPALIDVFLTEGWRIGVGYADADLTAAAAVFTGTPVTVTQPLTVHRLLTTLTHDTTRALHGTHTPLLRQATDAYRTAIYAAARDMATGTVTGRQAVGQAVDRMASRGIGAFIDRAGRAWRPDTYADMALRTAYTTAANTGRLERYRDRGHNLVIVSDASRECPLCRPWEGKILAIDGAMPLEGVTVAGTVAQATSAGLLHPRCRHSLNLYLPGLTAAAPATSDARGYVQDQAAKRARSQARVARARLAAAVEAGDPAGVARARARAVTAARAVRANPPVPLFPPSR